MNVIVSHPGRQHSYRLASALKHADMLDEYITTVYFKQSSKLLRLIAAVGGSDASKRIMGRRNADLRDSEVRQFLQARGIAETLMWRSRDPYHFDRFFRNTSTRFGIKVAREVLSRHADAVVTYGGHGAECFEILNRHHSKALKIIDIAVMPESMLTGFYEEILMDGLHDELRIEERQAVWGDGNSYRRARALELADYMLVPSDYVRNGLIQAGIPEYKIVKVPYGCNFGIASEKSNRGTGETIEFIFVGQVIVRKGAIELLRVFEKLRGTSCHLTVVGKYNSDASYIKELKSLENVTLCGLIPHDDVRKKLEQSDVFVLPTYNEGMSLSCLEAMGLGLPVVATPNAGVDDVLIDGVTGYKTGVADVQSLYQALNSFIDNPSSIRRMGEKAQEVAKQFTWEAYEERIASTFSNWLCCESIVHTGLESNDQPR